MAIYKFCRTYKHSCADDTDSENLWCHASSEQEARRRMEYEYPDTIEFVLLSVEKE